jgi:putative transcriptional regulator
MRIKQLTKAEREELRRTFYESITDEPYPLGETIRKMRQILGKTQPEFARLVKVAPRIISDLERGVGNPRLDTLNRIGRLFGLGVGFQRKAR